MTLQTSEPDVRAPSDEVEDVLNHYVHRDAILAGLIHGQLATALCGERFVPHAQGAGSVHLSNAVICSECLQLYDLLSK